MEVIELTNNVNKLDRILFQKIISKLDNLLKLYFIHKFDMYKNLFKFKSIEYAHEAIGSMYLSFFMSIILVKEKIDRENVSLILEENLYFSLLYGLVDHFLDCNVINKETKEKCINDMKKILYEGIRPDDPPDIIKTLYDIYHYFENRNRVIEMLRKSFEAELKSYKLQYNNQDEETYRKICAEKGNTMILLNKVINDIEIYENPDYILAYVLQLCDDIADVEKDKDDGIKTIVTFYLEKDNILDKLYYEVINEMNKVPNYIFYKNWVLILFYNVIIGSKHISENIKEKIKKYTSCKTEERINEKIGKTLCDIIRIN